MAAVERKKIAGRVSATATVEPDATRRSRRSPREFRLASVAHRRARPIRYARPAARAAQQRRALGEAKTQYLKTRSPERIAAQNLRREEELYAKKITPMKDVLAARADMIRRLPSTRRLARR